MGKFTGWACCMLAALLISWPISHAYALSAEQEAMYRLGIYAFDVVDDSCGRATTVDAAGITNAPKTTDLKSFVDAYAQSAFSVGKQYGIPYEAILAQGMLESGMGRSQLTQQANNFFGIKAGSNWSGPVISFNTGEQTSSGALYTVRAAFRVYASAEAGFAGYGQFITQNSRYAKALNYPTDYVAYIREIRAAGYATDVNYVSKVTSLANTAADYIKEKGLLPPSSSLQVSADRTDATKINLATNGSTLETNTTGPNGDLNASCAPSAVPAVSVAGGVTGKDTSGMTWALPFDKRFYDQYKENFYKNHHDGKAAIDVPMPSGTQLVAMFAGKISQHTTEIHSSYGYGVVVDAGNGVSVLYAHGTAGTQLPKGTAVQPKQLVMMSGNSGKSTGPHLHLEIRVNGKRVCPHPILVALATDKPVPDVRSLPSTNCGQSTSIQI